MGYIFLGLAIIACVAGSSALTASDGMVIKKYGVLGVLIFAISYVLLSRSILTINISIAYAVFCGVGIILSGIISMVVFKQRILFAKLNSGYLRNLSRQTSDRK